MPEIDDGDAIRLAVKYYEQSFSFEDAVRIVAILARTDLVGLLQSVYGQAVIDCKGGGIMVETSSTNLVKCQRCGQSIYPTQFHSIECCESYKAGQKDVVEVANKLVPVFHKGDAYKDKVMPNMDLGWEWRCDDDCPLCLWQSKLKDWRL